MKCNLFARVLPTTLFIALSFSFAWGQWEHLPAPDGGAVLQFDHDGQDLFALTKGGIYRSADAGAHWSLVESSVAFGGHMSQFQVEKGRLFILVDNSALLRSDNNGTSWTPVFQRPYPFNGPGEKLLHIFASGDTVLIGSVLSIYRSIDGGNNWQASGTYFKQHFVGFSKIGTELFAVFDGSIQRSIDGGLSWQSVFTIANDFSAMVAVDTLLYALYEGYPRLVRSGDGGRHWDKIDADALKDAVDYFNILLGRDSSLYLFASALCVRVLYYSEDRGLSWSAPHPWVYNEVPDWIKDASLLPSGLLIGSEAGAFFSKDTGGTFTAFHSGINAASVQTLFRSGTRWWTQTQFGTFFSDDDGQTWAMAFPGVLVDNCNSPMPVLGHTEKRVFYRHCALLYLEGQGAHWDTLNVPGPNCPEIAFRKKAAYILNGLSLFKFADNGTALQALKTPTGLGESGFHVQADETRLYLSDKFGYKLFYSNDEGLNWDSIPALNEGGQDRGTGFQLYSDSNHVYRLFYTYFRQAFIGAWNFSESSWSILPLVDPIYGDTINAHNVTLFADAGPLRFWGTYGRGLYYSSGSENHWYPYKPDFPANSPSAVFYTGNELWMGTAGSGIFRISLKFKTPEGPSPVFSLYPNPSSSAALTFTSDIFFTERIRLRVFDTTGRLLREEQLPPGQRWSLDYETLSPGMYVFQFRSAKFNAALKWVKR